MKKEYIADCLANYAKGGAVRLHMPGHKGKVEGSLSEAYSRDITELSFSDNLANPSGVIMLAEKDIAKICGAKRSHILTGGSTLGVLTAVFAVKNKGKKMIVQRGSHKSVFNALELFGIEPIFLNEKIEKGLFTGEFLNGELFDLADNGLIGALLTSPDYFGRALDLKNISKRLKKNNKLLIVDGAHGAHFVFDNPTLYAGNYADIWVDGAHKTLQTLTQGAVLNVNNEQLLEGVKEGLSIFSTSSPSYLIMSSVENGVKGYADIKKQNESSFSVAKQLLINGALEAGFSILNTDDPLKVTILCNGFGNELGELLEKQNIFAELVADNAILFMLSLKFSNEEALRVVNALKRASLKGENRDIKMPLPVRKMGYVEARKSKSESVLLKNALGRICAQNTGLFPPCYPVITAGEVYDSSVIERLSAKNTFGVEGGFVKVVKE